MISSMSSKSLVIRKYIINTIRSTNAISIRSFNTSTDNQNKNIIHMNQNINTQVKGDISVGNYLNNQQSNNTHTISSITNENKIDCNLNYINTSELYKNIIDNINLPINLDTVISFQLNGNKADSCIIKLKLYADILNSNMSNDQNNYLIDLNSFNLLIFSNLVNNNALNNINYVPFFLKNPEFQTPQLFELFIYSIIKEGLDNSSTLHSKYLWGVVRKMEKKFLLFSKYNNYFLFELLLNEYISKKDVTHSYRVWQMLHKTQVPLNSGIYEQLIKLADISNDIGLSSKLWLNLKKTNIKPTFDSIETMIKISSQHKKYPQVIQFYNELIKVYFNPTSSAFYTVIMACDRIHRFDLALDICLKIERTNNCIDLLYQIKKKIAHDMDLLDRYEDFLARFKTMRPKVYANFKQSDNQSLTNL